MPHSLSRAHSASLTEQHPLQQGLKLNPNAFSSYSRVVLPSNIHYNKDLNPFPTLNANLLSLLTEQHPLQQGLKLGQQKWNYIGSTALTEQHPLQQGLKLDLSHNARQTNTNLPSNIHYNK